MRARSPCGQGAAAIVGNLDLSVAWAPPTIYMGEGPTRAPNYHRSIQGDSEGSHTLSLDGLTRKTRIHIF